MQVGDYLVTVTKADGRRIGQLHFKRVVPGRGLGGRRQRGENHADAGGDGCREAIVVLSFSL